MTVRGSKKGVLRIAQYSLWTCALSLFGYCGFETTDRWIFQNRERRQLEMFSRVSAKTFPAEAFVGLIGRVEIPRLDVSVIVMEGSTDKTLRRAAGHIAGTALPGQPGNVGISAHRDTFFRPLRDIRAGDLIAVTTLSGAFRYRVVSTRIVVPTDLSVLKPGKSETLTLVTCYPFYFIGPAPDRFIVRAERIL